MLRLSYWQKENINAHLFVSTKEFTKSCENSACYSRKTNILYFQLLVGPWNYMSVMTSEAQPGLNFTETMNKSYKKWN